MTQSPPPAAAAAVCAVCGADEGRLLHHVRQRGLFRRLCTTCVLRLHPQSFCPSCFSLFPHPPPPSSDSISCSKCYSSTHPHCLPSPASAAPPYVCPPCRNPTSKIFNPNLTQTLDGQNVKKMDPDSARALLAAAKIAALSMAKAAVAARAEAERRAKEAAATRKRAREALEDVALLVGREKVKRRENVVEGSGNGVDGPSEVSARLNAVGLREREKVVQVIDLDNNGLQQSQENHGGEGSIDPQ